MSAGRPRNNARDQVFDVVCEASKFFCSHRPSRSRQALISLPAGVIEARDGDLDLRANNREGGLQSRAMMSFAAAESVSRPGQNTNARAKTGFVDQRHCTLIVACRRGVSCQCEIHPTSLHPTKELGAPNDALLDQVLVYELVQRSRVSHASGCDRPGRCVYRSSHLL